MNPKVTKFEHFRAVWDAPGKESEAIGVLFDTRKLGIGAPADMRDWPMGKAGIEISKAQPGECLSVTAVGISGVFPMEAGAVYLFIPWKAVCWIGRGMGTPAAAGVTWTDDLPLDWRDPATLTARQRGEILGWRVLDGGKA